MAYNPNFPADDELLVGPPFREQFNSLKAIMDAQAATIAALEARLAAVEAQTPPTGALNVQSLDSANQVSGNCLISSGWIGLAGRWTFNVEGQGNVTLTDSVTGYSTNLTSIPI